MSSSDGRRRRPRARVPLAVAVAIPLAIQGAAAEDLAGYWPGGAAGAVSLAFDDGMPSQLDRAAPLLDRLSLRATFYVNPGVSVDWAKNLDRWRRLAAAGHEIGNHTDRHPCSCHNTFRKEEDYCLERLEMSEIVRSIEDANRLLQELLPTGRAPATFAYPCYESFIGSGTGRRSYVPEVARRFLAGRAGEDRANDPRIVDLAHLYGFTADTFSADRLVEAIDRAVAKGFWAIIVYHGIGAEWNRVEVADLEKVLRHLAARRDRIWTATVGDVAAHIAIRR
ncbi:MAG: polysaccharide deacetylase family protein [Hyphomicrobiales bacterium]|nr:polysaccharide deacetylase family protein [Hyphomicrobiales bacterium]